MKVRSNLSIDEQVELQLRASPKRLVGSWWVVSGTLRKVVHLTKKRVIMVMASNIETEPLKIPLHQLFTDECIFLGYGFIRPHQFVTDVRNGWMFRTDRYDPETIWLDLVSSNATSTLLQQSSYDLPGVYWYVSWISCSFLEPCQTNWMGSTNGETSVRHTRTD